MPTKPSLRSAAGSTSVSASVHPDNAQNAEAGPSTPLRTRGHAPAAAASTTRTPAANGTPRSAPRGSRSGRALRARASSPGVPKRPGSRIITADEEARALFKLSQDGTAARRAEILPDLEARVRGIVAEHDMAVKEKFHLERYVSILEGWDPAEAKVDNSPVFLEYKHQHHDLLSLVHTNVVPFASPGPSARYRPAAPARTTRRQLHQKNQALGNLTTLGAKEKAKEEADPADKSKGKARAESEPQPEPEPVPKTEDTTTPAKLSAPTPASRSRKGRTSKMPPPVPSRKSRRATTHGAAPPADPEPEAEEPAPTPVPTGKKRPRQSMPNLPTKKARALEAVAATASPASSPAPTTPAARSPTPEPPAPLPSLAHIPFPPPPHRPAFRRNAAAAIFTYTDPNQRPPPAKFGGDAEALLESYLHIEDVGPPVDLPTLQARAAREGYIRNRVNWLQHQGRLMRLLDQDDEPVPDNKRNTRHERKIPTGPPPRQTDFQDSLMAHMVQVRNAMMAEAKIKPVVCKKIARMVQVYWEHIHTKDERARVAEERERKRKAKEVVKALKKRWGLAIKIIRAKVREAQKMEQDRLGKEHLQNMLQRSTGLLEGQRDVIVGREGTEDDDGDQSDAGTDEVSAAEESEEEAEEDDAVDAEEADDQEEHDDDEGGDEDGDDSGSDEDAPETPRVDYHAMLGIKQEAVDTTAHALEMDVEISADAVVDVEQPQQAEETPTDPPAVPSTEVTAPSNAPQPEPEPPVTSDVTPAEHMDVDVDVPFAEVRFDAITMDEIDASFGPVSSTQTPADTPAEIRPKTPEPVCAQTTDDVAPGPLTNPSPAPVTSAPETEAAAPVSSPPAPVSSPPPPPRALSRRLARKSRALAAAAAVPDPDADDTEFKAQDTNEADAKLDAEMDTQADGGDSEDEGLLADAEMPIEELLKRYGYPMPVAEAEAESVTEGTEAGDEANGETQPPEDDVEMADVSMAIDVPSSDPLPAAEAAVEAQVVRIAVPTPDEPAVPTEAAPEVKTDQSLTDEALALRQSSPALVVEGKRQRKARVVWTPPDEPQHAAGKPRKPKVEVAPEPEAQVQASEEEEEEEDEDEGEEEDEDEDEEMDEDEAQEVAEATAEPEDPNVPRVRPPFLLRGTLRPYQQAGLEWLASLYANNMNGILADEMGLGKTIQTISLLGHLACDKGVWGQHLIIVPTSVILNWEMEFKKFLPGMKVLTYYGNQKERKEKRVGWNTENAWQVCITSYQIVLADQHIFRRKNWVYMILDEAHNIKNFRSQRWQTLLGFKAQRRLLLTGTPLQNNLMELWSLLYFLMPNGITADATAVVGFANHRDFTEWFSNPMDKAVELGETLDEETIETVSKLHTLLRPFILRRLKADVEKQLPGKFEHVVYCRLSKRQRFLYDEFMSRASTREALNSGGYLGVMNTLMQLRKVCNHPDLFEVRPVRTSFAMERGVLSDFEPTDLLVRRRLLAKHDEELDLDGMGLLVTGHEDESGWVSRSRQQLDASDRLPYALEPIRKGVRPPKADLRTMAGWAKYRAFMDHKAEVARWHTLRTVNHRRCIGGGPLYGRTTLEMLVDLPQYLLPESVLTRRKMDWFAEHTPPAAALVQSLPERLASVSPLVDRFAVIPPNAVARDVATYALAGVNRMDPTLQDPMFDTLHQPSVKLQIAFPDVSLLQYDCGKLQKLAEMLRDLKANGHRVLIFTQMTRVLDILEIFLSYNGHRYLRLDGRTKIEDRQVLTERFNSDSRIFCFIASSRSGGVGINLTGADTVFFYDSDWNPSMDRQCMDRAHRIGQTREVHIYRFVSSHTVEENMLKKANQKRLLDRVVIQDGDFTTEFFGKMDWRDMLDDTMMPAPEDEETRIEDVAVEAQDTEEDVAIAEPRAGKERELALALAQVEDEEDAAAARVAQGEGEMDFADFGDEGRKAKRGEGEGDAPSNPAIARLGERERAGTGTCTGTATGTATATHSESATPFPDADADAEQVAHAEEDEYYDEDEPGAIDEYMLRYVEWEWEAHFCNM